MKKMKKFHGKKKKIKIIKKNLPQDRETLMRGFNNINNEKNDSTKNETKSRKISKINKL
jgi:hypothetical protein